jgi:acetyl-CoA acyltransferase
MGVWQIAELTLQLRGQAGGRQVPNAKVGLAHNAGIYARGIGNDLQGR